MVTHQSEADVRAFLPGQAWLAEELGAPLAIVDNASTDGTREAVRELRSPAVEMVELDRNLGYAAAVNRAAAVMPGLDLLLLNPDVEAPAPGDLNALAAVLDANPRAAVSAPRLVGEDGEAQPSARRFPSLGALLGSKQRLRALAPVRRAYERYLEPSQASASCVVDWVIGAAMLIRRAAFDEVGGFDERFFLYVEDVDFCRRCARAGWEVWFVPQVRMRHAYPRVSSAAHASVLGSRARRLHVVSHARLFAREPRLMLGRGRRA